MTNKSTKDYTCIRCGIRRGVKRYVFSEDGFMREANMCMCCADETHVLQLASDYNNLMAKAREMHEPEAESLERNK